MQNPTTACEVRKSLNIVLTVGSSARRYLASEMNADRDYLALAWVESGWIVGILPEELPDDAWLLLDRFRWAPERRDRYREALSVDPRANIDHDCVFEVAEK